MPNLDDNPLLRDWIEADQFPPFAHINPAHLLSAVDHLASKELACLDAIAECQDAPTFENTVLPFERTSGSFDRVAALLEILSSTVSTDELRDVEASVSARLARHRVQVLR